MNKIHKFRKTACHLLLLVMSIFLSACAAKPVATDDYVIERAQERRELLIAGDLEQAYTYYSPGYRSTHSLIDFGVQERTRRVQQTSAKYLSHQCEESRCIVVFEMGFRVAVPIPGMTTYDGTSKVEDTWIKTNGDWWYLPKN